MLFGIGRSTTGPRMLGKSALKHIHVRFAIVAVRGANDSMSNETDLRSLGMINDVSR